MKLIIVCISLLSFSFAFGQAPDLHKLWVGKLNNYLKIDSNIIKVEFYYTHEGKTYTNMWGFRYSLTNDTLRIFNREYDFLHKCDSIVHHDFLITRVTANELKLHSLFRDSWWLVFTGGPDPLKDLNYRELHTLYTDTIHFEKLLFKSTTCYGGCPALSFQIENNKQMKFVGDKYSFKTGSYTATLADQQYTQLLNLLALANLDKLQNPARFNVDAPTYTIEVHYNNKVRVIKSFIMPYIAEDLLNYLRDLPKQVDLRDSAPITLTFSQ